MLSSRKEKAYLRTIDMQEREIKRLSAFVQDLQATNTEYLMRTREAEYQLHHHTAAPQPKTPHDAPAS